MKIGNLIIEKQAYAGEKLCVFVIVGITTIDSLRVVGSNSLGEMQISQIPRLWANKYFEVLA